MNEVRRRMVAATEAAHAAVVQRPGRGKAGVAEERAARALVFLRELTADGTRPLPRFVSSAFLVGYWSTKPADATALLRMAKRMEPGMRWPSAATILVEAREEGTGT
jgi:hypothetical protein